MEVLGGLVVAGGLVMDRTDMGTCFILFGASESVVAAGRAAMCCVRNWLQWLGAGGIRPVLLLGGVWSSGLIFSGGTWNWVRR